MPYVVNKDSAHPPTIHNAACRYAQTRQKMSQNGRWSPEFATYAEALAWAAQGQITQQPRDCQICNPLH